MKSKDKDLELKTDKNDNHLDTASEGTPLLNDKSVILLDQLIAGCNDVVEYGPYGKIVQNYRKSGYEEIITQKLKSIEEDNIESGLMNNCFISLLLSPVYVLFYITLPKKCPIFTFVVSIGYMSGLSYFTVWAISGLSNQFLIIFFNVFNNCFNSKIGDTLAIPQTISGMTILAAGSAGIHQFFN